MKEEPTGCSSTLPIRNIALSLQVEGSSESEIRITRNDQTDSSE
jgi:hypothetical protein